MVVVFVMMVVVVGLLWLVGLHAAMSALERPLPPPPSPHPQLSVKMSARSIFVRAVCVASRAIEPLGPGPRISTKLGMLGCWDVSVGRMARTSLHARMHALRAAYWRRHHNDNGLNLCTYLPASLPYRLIVHLPGSLSTLYLCRSTITAAVPPRFHTSICSQVRYVSFFTP